MENQKRDNPYKKSVHRTLAHSYSTYFVFFLAGLCLDLIFQLKFFDGSLSVPLGFFLLVVAALLIFWAQKTSKNLNKENLSKKTFSHGPYSFTRSPTHWGLFLLMLGFGLVANAFFVVLSSLAAFVLTELVFLEKEEKMLEEKYGSHYSEYKKSVKI